MYDEYDDGSGGRSPDPHHCHRGGRPGDRRRRLVPGEAADRRATTTAAGHPGSGGEHDVDRAATPARGVARRRDRRDRRGRRSGDDRRARRPRSTEAPTHDGRAGDDAAPTTTAAPTTARRRTTPPAPAAPADPGYDVLPDGSPAPVVAIFGFDQITHHRRGARSGCRRPPDHAGHRQQQVRRAGCQLPHDQPQRAAHRSRAGRRADLDPLPREQRRDPSGARARAGPCRHHHERPAEHLGASSSVMPMQRGDELVNYAISDERARAVFNHLVAGGISPHGSPPGRSARQTSSRSTTTTPPTS